MIKRLRKAAKRTHRQRFVRTQIYPADLNMLLDAAERPFETCVLCGSMSTVGTTVEYLEAGKPERAHPDCVREPHLIDPEGRR